jgi:phosphoserine phosphatase RsbU/P
MNRNAAAVDRAEAPGILVVRGGKREHLNLYDGSLTIGRHKDRDLAFEEPHVSRLHARLEVSGTSAVIIDEGSSHGTFVNGDKVQRHQLQPGDRMEFGARGVSFIIFCPSAAAQYVAEAPLSIANQTRFLQRSPADATELDTFRMFMEATLSFSSTGEITQVLETLIETALRLTQAERGFVFLTDGSGELKLAAGRNARGETLTEAKDISRSVLREAAAGASEFLMFGTEDDAKIAMRQSIVAHDLRTIACLPLRHSDLRPAVAGSLAMGVLYLDSHLITGKLSAVSDQLLRRLAREAASLVENACLVKAEQEARAYQRELAIAAAIQQQLMIGKVPEIPFATVSAHSIPCKEVGGDFFDVIELGESVGVIVADVSGKGIPAALLASTLQGLIYPQLLQHVPLGRIAEMVNSFLYSKVAGRKYATLTVARLDLYGTLEYINCGHVQPILCSAGNVSRLKNSNLPVGLLSSANFASDIVKVSPGDRLVFVTDGIVEAENASEESFDDQRLEEAVARSCDLDEIFRSVDEFREGVPLGDDCTCLQLQYRG